MAAKAAKNVTKTNVEKSTPAAATPPARGKRHWIFWMPLVLLVCLVAAAPTVASWTPLGRWVVRRNVPVNGSLEIGSVSIGWFSVLSLEQVVLRDPAGEAVAELPTARGDKSLVQLLWNRNGLGQFIVADPALKIVLTEKGSNLEEVLAPLLVKGESTQPVVVGVQVSGGVILVDDRVSQRAYQFHEVRTELQFDGSSKKPLNVDAEAKLVDGRRTSALAIKLDDHSLPSSEVPLGSGHLTCQIDRLPLDVLEPLARRKIAGVQLAGWLTTQLDCTWGGGDAHDQTSVEGQISAADLLIAAEVLGHDRIEMARLQTPCRIVGSGETVSIEKLELDCDLGKVSVMGRARLADFAARDVLGALAHEPCQVTGQLDLVRLAALLPETLRIRPDTQITAGELSLNLASQPQASGMGWAGRIATSDLEATAQGQELKWQQPLAVEFQAHDGGDGLIVDKLDCTASFLQIEGGGTLDQLTADARFDLNKLAAELDRFVDLHDVVLAGQGQAKLSWQRDAAGHARGHADVRAHEFALVTPGRRPWREADLLVKLDATGTLDGTTLKQLATASVELDAAEERLIAKLAAPVDDPLTSPWPLQVDWHGELASLPPRLEPWVNLAGYDLRGQADLQGLIALSHDDLQVQQGKLSATGLHVFGHGLYIDERQAEISGNVRWQRSKGKLEVPLASLKGSAIVARLNDIELGSAGAGIQASGNVTLQADLATIERWTHDPRAARTRSVAGQLGGQIDLGYSQGVSSAKLNVAVENLVVTSLQAAPEQPGRVFQPAGQQLLTSTWQEPRLALAARLDYDSGRDALQVTHGELSGQTMRATLDGSVAHLRSVPELDVTGDVQCDWEQTAPLWRPYLGNDVEITGRQPWPFALRGPWTAGVTPWLAGAQRMAGQLSVKWSSATCSGLHVSGGSIDARLADGVLTLVPVGVEIGGGRLTCSPIVRLATQPPQIEIPRGPLISQVELTPEICARGLKFVVPVLAEVTRTSGNFSIELEGGRLPLADLGAGDVTGQLSIHSIEMQPGPILQTLLGFGQQLEGVLQGQVPFANGLRPVAIARMENQTVDFRLVDRRVYHRGLQFEAGNVTISTRGSVGLDESLAVLAEVPLPPRLLEQLKNPAQASNRSVQIPVEGTLHKPKIDPRAIEKLTGAMIQNTAQGLLLNPLENALEKLLPGAPQP